jgi:hypothetical protein
VAGLDWAGFEEGVVEKVTADDLCLQPQASIHDFILKQVSRPLSTVSLNSQSRLWVSLIAGRERREFGSGESIGLHWPCRLSGKGAARRQPYAYVSM